MRNEILRELIEEVESVDLDEQAKQIFRRVIHCIAARNGVTCFERDEQLAFINQLRVLGERPSTIRERLMMRFGISRTTAYERIGEALELSGKLTIFRTKQAFNDDMEIGFKPNEEQE